MNCRRRLGLEEGMLRVRGVALRGHGCDLKGCDADWGDGIHGALSRREELERKLNGRELQGKEGTKLEF